MLTVRPWSPGVDSHLCGFCWPHHASLPPTPTPHPPAGGGTGATVCERSAATDATGECKGCIRLGKQGCATQADCCDGANGVFCISGVCK